MEKNKTIEFFDKIEITLLIVSIASLALGFLPMFQNPFNTGKLLLGVVFTGLLFLVKAIKKAISGNPSINVSNFDLAVLLLVASFVISSFVRTPNKLEAFWLPGTTSFLLLGMMLYFAITQLESAGKRFVAYSLICISALIAVFSLLSNIGTLESLTFLPSLIRLNGFNPTGSTLNAAIFIAAILPLTVSLIMHSPVHKKAILGVLLAITSLGLASNILSLLHNNVPLPGFTTSWIVATEALKANPVFGVGVSNYLSAYSRFLPLSYNLTPLWSIRFSNSQNMYFTVLTENGLLGIAALLFFSYLSIKIVQKSREHAAARVASISLLSLLVLLAVFPASPVHLIMLFVLAGLVVKTKGVHFGINPGSTSHPAYLKAPTIIVSLLLVALVLGAFVATAKFASAEYTFNKAMAAVGNNDGKSAYELLGSAINTAPYVDRYHVSYSQLNLALANAISQKKDLSDADKNTIAQLIQQSIREGKVSVILNQERSANWASLASIYKAVIPLAQGADQYAVQSYSQAITLDPINPNLRIALGGIFYSAKRFDDAADVFKLATVASPQFANAHYNLALTYRELGQYDKALAEMNTVLSLVSKDSNDYKVAQKEIDNLKSKQPKKEDAQNGSDLTAPKADNQNLNPKLKLPEDATPPATPVVDSVKGAETAAPSATPSQ